MIHNTRRRVAARSLVVLTAVALPGVVPLLTAVDSASADGPVRAGAKRHYKTAKGRTAHGRRGGSAHHKIKIRPGGHLLGGRRPAQATISLGTSSPGVPVLPGRTYNWPFSVTNSGPVAAAPVTFTAPLPKSLEFVSAEQNCSFKGSMAVCELGAMKPGETKMGMVTAKVSREAKPREAIGGTAAVTWGRSRVARAFPQVNVAETADVAVTKAGPALVRPGAVVPYEIKVRNQGSAIAQNVMLTDIVKAKAPVEVVDSGVGCSQRGAGTVCNVGALSIGQERTVSLRVRLGPSIKPGTVIQAPAKVTTSTVELNVANNEANVRTKVRGGPYKPGITVVKSRKLSEKANSGLTRSRGGLTGSRAGARPPLGGPPTRGAAELPRTGVESSLLTDVALGLVGTGLILLRLGRRRSRRDLGSPESG